MMAPGRGGGGVGTAFTRPGPWPADRHAALGAPLPATEARYQTVTSRAASEVFQGISFCSASFTRAFSVKASSMIVATGATRISTTSSEPTAASVRGSAPWTTFSACGVPLDALRVMRRIEAGMVYVNLVLADSPELPFGGVKRSGTSREMGLIGADEFVNKKLVRVAPHAG